MSIGNILKGSSDTSSDAWIERKQRRIADGTE